MHIIIPTKQFGQIKYDSTEKNTYNCDIKLCFTHNKFFPQQFVYR